ncbi:MAG: universal stress protein [Proteobacteria bacterium]|nr:universal stress protein [Pseudomonadota bacterium]MBU1708775.1 universal stress protein [Pseudomonadota bacterium]
MNDWGKILVAIDETPASERALRYLGKFAGRIGSSEVCLLHIYPEPEQGLLKDGQSAADYQKGKRSIARKILQKGATLLEGCSVSPEKISRECRMASGKTISQIILQVQEEGGFGTVVVGKRKVSRSDDFLFGSILKSLVHQGESFTLWVVS